MRLDRWGRRLARAFFTLPMPTDGLVRPVLEADRREWSDLVEGDGDTAGAAGGGNCPPRSAPNEGNGLAPTGRGAAPSARPSPVLRARAVEGA